MQHSAIPFFLETSSPTWMDIDRSIQNLQPQSPYHMIYVGNDEILLLSDDNRTPKISQRMYETLCRIEDLSRFQFFTTTLGLNLHEHQTFSNIMKLACKNNHLHVAQWVLEQYRKKTPTLPRVIQNQLFSYACKYGHLNMAIQSPPSKITIWQRAFLDTCRNGHLHIAQWINMKHPDFLSPCVLLAFDNACTHGHFHIAQWLWSIHAPSIVRMIDQYLSSGRHTFENACNNGHLRIAQWLARLEPFNHTITSTNSTFKSICLHGHFAVARWFQQTYRLFNQTHQDAFFLACSYGNLILAQWLWYDVMDPATRKIDSQLFGITCRYGHINVVRAFWDQWPPISSTQERNAILAETCVSGHFRLAQWLVAQWKGRVDPHADEDLGFRWICSNGRLSFVKTFCTIFGVSDFGFNKGFINACRQGRDRVVWWLWDFDRRRPSPVLTLKTKQHGFKEACVFEYGSIIRWIWNQHVAQKAQDGEGIFPRPFYNQLFMDMCGAGQFETARLLWELNSAPIISSHQTFKESFRLACQRGSLKIIKWLWELNTTTLSYPIIRKKDMCTIIKRVKKYNHDHVIDWLNGINKHQ